MSFQRYQDAINNHSNKFKIIIIKKDYHIMDFLFNIYHFMHLLSIYYAI